MNRYLVTSLVVVHALAAPTVIVAVALGWALGGAVVVLEAPSGGPDTRALAVKPAAPRPLPTRGADAESRDEAPEWTDVAHVRREVFLSMGAELSALRRGGRLLPIRREGQLVGFRFAGLPRDGLLWLMGFRDGDELHGVNGRSPDSGVSLCFREWARQPAVVVLDMIRGGRRGTIVLLTEEARAPDVGARAPGRGRAC